MKLASVFLMLHNQRRIQNPIKHLRRRFSAKMANRFQLLIIFPKSFIVDVRLGSQYTSDNPATRVKQGKLNLQGDGFSRYVMVISFFLFQSLLLSSICFIMANFNHTSKRVHRRFEPGNSEILTQKLTLRGAIP